MNNPQTAPMGRTMLIICWVLALGLLTLFFGRWEDNQANPNQRPESLRNQSQTLVTLQANRQHHYVANGSINGQNALFLLDTGATNVSVPAHLAESFGLERGRPMTSQTANGPVTVYATTINQLSLGEITLYNLRGSINPGMRGDEILLGMSALKQVELRQRGDTLTLIQHH
ncbi:TIGR02281 family clan AA aspartic protease [Simiduia sp. 21SJ11W-1]|uniref:retropepsin-like aspartic protease family protein n=1 Tax=Simiduia sp. 21SJ11W-1 TaxID=2909669 RepID=UPI0020A11977|nr:TIGR02281 family clan AA aspartic protease [Simiduia sp. 21SJ11W-1]UTA48889.1 TIGR02281 family clan AA aspartic protease [Simiduia sp. 21SJ11W-1]